ncbi:hypothetical protein GCM10010371_65480 [Streptomyces subrutilus]|uniref:Uncharacterized protein n=1 Tax=Streptomyces subrutilus TaxID=36818 RepID=A0A918RFX5_9ACTN|nr:hypothetical protein GCM10010371_65480 [Streptomyces subrutilus]
MGAGRAAVRGARAGPPVLRGGPGRRAGHVAPAGWGQWMTLKLRQGRVWGAVTLERVVAT